MATTTTNLGLKKPYESDYFNINDFNGNMDKIDNLVHIVESGTEDSDKTSPGGDSPDGAVEWHYKKYSDGTLEAQASFTTSHLICNEKGYDGTWISKYIRVKYPELGQTAVFYKNASVALSNGNVNGTNYTCSNWVIDRSSVGTASTYQTVELAALKQESIYVEKVIYLEFKGTWDYPGPS